MRLPRTWGAWAVLACVIVVLIFFVRSSWTYGKSLNPAPAGGRDFHNLIADAFAEGQTSLTIEPPKRLLRLRDPYDPEANLAYRQGGLHDLSLYDGKIYAFYGPAPAVLAFLPFRALNVGDLTPTLAVLAFCCIGFLFSYLLFRLLAEYLEIEVRPWQACLAVLALGLGTPVAWTIAVGQAYEVATACGYALLFVGMYFLARGLLRSNAELVSVLGGSAALGLAVAARASLAAGALFIALAAVLITRVLDVDRRRFLVALIAPYATIGVLLVLYNYLRFDSLLEFGQSYQLSGANSRTYPFGRLSYLPKGLYYYLFSPGRVSRDYPYLYLRANELLPGVDPTTYKNPPVAGAFTNMPANLVGLVLGGIAWPTISASTKRAFATIGALLAVAAVPLVVSSYYFAGTTFRYELDFVPLITLAAVLGWALWSRTRHRSVWTERLGHAIWGGALAGSVAFNLAITFTPCQGTGSC